MLGGFEKKVNCEFQSGIKEDYKSSSSEFGIANPEQREGIKLYINLMKE